MKSSLGRNWWILAARGVLAILFGLYALLVPGLALATVILAFGVAVLISGVLSIVAAVRVHDQGQRSIPIFIEGLMCLAFGLLALLKPGAAALAWLYVVSGFALASGILHIVAAVELRKLFEGEWVLILNGALTALFGVFMILLPWAGLLSLIVLVGAYSLFFGSLLLALAIRLRLRWHARPAARR